MRGSQHDPSAQGQALFRGRSPNPPLQSLSVLLGQFPFGSTFAQTERISYEALIYHYVLYGLLTGRVLFEKVIRENLVGHSKQVQLIFDRWVTKSAPALFRSRVITDGIVPSLHAENKGNRRHYCK